MDNVTPRTNRRLTKQAVAHLIGQPECKRLVVRPITFQVLLRFQNAFDGLFDRCIFEVNAKRFSKCSKYKVVNSTLISHDVYHYSSQHPTLYETNTSWHGRFSSDPNMTHQFLPSKKTPDMPDTRYQRVRVILWQREEAILQCKQYCPWAPRGISLELCGVDPLIEIWPELPSQSLNFWVASARAPSHIW